MKKLFLLLTLSIFVLSCDKSSENIYSKNIQDTFFGVKFGANKDIVIEVFEKEGILLEHGEYSTNIQTLRFTPKGEYISFCGMNWDYISCRFSSDDKFFGIQFVNTSKNIETALKKFDSVFLELSSRHKMFAHPIEDENIYKHYGAVSKDKKRVQVVCQKVESFLTTFYNVNLTYGDISKAKR